MARKDFRGQVALVTGAGYGVRAAVEAVKGYAAGQTRH
jgi:hypothetical protein